MRQKCHHRAPQLGRRQSTIKKPQHLHHPLRTTQPARTVANGLAAPKRTRRAETASQAPPMRGLFPVTMNDGSRNLADLEAMGVECVGLLHNTAYRRVGIPAALPELGIEYSVYRVPPERYVAFSWTGPRTGRVFSGKEVAPAEAAAEFVKDGLPVPPGLALPAVEPLLAVARHGPPSVQAESAAADEDCGSSGAGDAPRGSADRATFEKRAIATEDGIHWYSYRLQRSKKWVQWRMVRLRPGQQTELFRRLVRGGGRLAKTEALVVWHVRYKSRDYAGIMKLLKPELSRLRDAMREALNLSDSCADPLPFDAQTKSWQAALLIGCALAEDSGWVIKSSEELSTEQRLDLASNLGR